MVRNLLVLLSTIFVVVNAFNNHNENHGGYPTWFSKSNRMLLSKFKDVVQPNVTVAKKRNCSECVDLFIDQMC
jgi:hypothetical protein